MEVYDELVEIGRFSRSQALPGYLSRLLGTQTRQNNDGGPVVAATTKMLSGQSTIDCDEIDRLIIHNVV